MQDFTDERFMVRREICTEIVFRDPVTGCTHREVNRQMQVHGIPGLPVLMTDHNRNTLPFLNSSSWEQKAEPLRDPNLGRYKSQAGEEHKC